MDRYTAGANASVERALDRGHSLAEGLRRFYDNALAIYFESGAPPRGCYLIGTATTEARADPEVGAKLRESLAGFERAIEARMRDAKTAGELDASADPAALKALTDTAIQLICGNFRPLATSARPSKKAT